MGKSPRPTSPVRSILAMLLVVGSLPVDALLLSAFRAEAQALGPPTATLELKPAAIIESAGVSKVTATLSHGSSEGVTLTVSAAPGSADTKEGDFRLSQTSALIFGPGETMSTNKVSITAMDNDDDTPDKVVTVSVAVSSGIAIASAHRTLTIMDDDNAPIVALAVANSSIAENGGTTRVTAVMNRASSEPTAVTVTPATESYMVGSPATLTIPVGTTASTGTGVTIMAVTDLIDNVGNRQVRVTGTATNSHGIVPTATSASLTLIDDEDDVLVLSESVVREWAGSLVAAFSSYELDMQDWVYNELQPASQGSDTDKWFRAAVARTLADGAVDVLGSRFDAPTINDKFTPTLWYRRSMGGFSGFPVADLELDGSFRTHWGGLDDWTVPTLLTGMAVARGEGTVKRERTNATTTEAEVTLTGMAVYARLAAHYAKQKRLPDLELWGLLGVGGGEVESTAPAGDVQTAGITSRMGAVGGRLLLFSWDQVDIAAKADAFASTLRTKRTVTLPEARGNARSVRISIDGSFLRKIGGVRVVPRLTAGGRRDDGTANSGIGLEVGGGLALTYTGWGLHGELQGRRLLWHSADGYEDWGVSLGIRLILPVTVCRHNGCKDND